MIEKQIKYFEFLSLNVLFIGIIALVVMIYLAMLIKKRRKEKFLHSERK